MSDAVTAIPFRLTSTTQQGHRCKSSPFQISSFTESHDNTDPTPRTRKTKCPSNTYTETGSEARIPFFVGHQAAAVVRVQAEIGYSSALASPRLGGANAGNLEARARLKLARTPQAQLMCSKLTDTASIGHKIHIPPS